MVILAFYSVENNFSWGRDTFDSNTDEQAFAMLWDKREELSARFYAIEDASYGGGEYICEISNGCDFEEDFNDEVLDGGWWVKRLELDREVLVNLTIRRDTDPDEGELELCSEEFFGDICPEVKMMMYDGFAEGGGVRLEYPKVADLTQEQIREIERYTGRIYDSGYVCPNDVAVTFGKIVSFNGIMETGTSHDQDLVRKINIAWLEDKDEFKPILCALYEQQIDEITNADSFQIDMWCPDNADGCRREIVEAFNKGKQTGDWRDYNKLALEDMVREWDFFAENYLMHIADDQDLRTILSFLRK